MAADSCRSKPRVRGPGVVRLHLQLRGQRRREPADRQLRIQLTYTDHGSNPIGSSFSIQGTADKIDPVLESMICIGQNPPPGGNELIFLAATGQRHRRRQASPKRGRD